MMYLSPICAIGLVVWILPQAGASPRNEVEELAARFDRMNHRVNNGQGYCASLNTTGELAWGESYVLRSYIEMYRATRDIAYLDSFVEHFDHVLSNRDDVHHRRDFYRKTSLASWGSNEYSGTHWHVWAVHTGMICQPAAEFVRLVRGVRKLRKIYSQKADEYLARIKEAVAVHDPEWRDGPNPGEGHYVDSSMSNRPVPLNQQNALGSVLVELYRITLDHTYKDRATQLAAYFKRQLRITPDGTYEWGYEANGPGAEDISHAAINVDFAVRCRWAHIAFKDKDMRLFANTWARRVRRAPGEWANTVAGTGGPNTHMPQAVGRWLDLCQWNPVILPDARIALNSMDEEKANGANMLVIAKLARWERQLRHKLPASEPVEALEGAGTE